MAGLNATAAALYTEGSGRRLSFQAFLSEAVAQCCIDRLIQLVAAGFQCVEGTHAPGRVEHPVGTGVQHKGAAADIRTLAGALNTIHVCLDFGIIAGHVCNVCLRQLRS